MFHFRRHIVSPCTNNRACQEAAQLHWDSQLIGDLHNQKDNSKLNIINSCWPVRMCFIYSILHITSHMYKVHILSNLLCKNKMLIYPLDELTMRNVDLLLA